jgi:xylulokinase
LPKPAESFPISFQRCALRGASDFSMLTLGVDSGTQSTKSIVLDCESGEIIASARERYGFIEGLPTGHLEQDPETWTDAVNKTVFACIEQLGDRKNEIEAIGVSGQQHGLVVMDKKNRPIRPAKLWCDTSTQDQCAKFGKKFGGAEGLIELAGNPILPGYTASKLLWLKEKEPRNFRAVNCVLLPHDYLNFWLTGEKRMEYGDASGTGLLDIRTRTWCGPLVEFIDPRLAEALPAPETSRRVLGLLRDSLRENWGLSKSLVVSAGGGDNMMGAIGTGNIRPGLITASLGTSGTLYSCSEEPVIDAGGEVAAFCDSTDRWLPLICTMNVTVATEQVRNMFGWSLEQLEDAWRRVSAGSDGLLFLPYLTGERTPNLPDGCGVFHGLTTTNMHAAQIARATVEGVTLGLAYGLGRFRELGIMPSEIRLTGGGSQSATWRQIAADIFDVSTVCLESVEGAALGAAIQARWAYGQVQSKPVRFADLTDRFVKIDESTRTFPDPANRGLYDDTLKKLTNLTRRLHAGGLL